jgi:hypothetical protein
MQKHYFELDKVESIILTHETESSYRWFPSIPPSHKTFLGIKYGMKPGIIAGWNNNIDDEGKELQYKTWDRKQSSYFKDYEWYRVDEVGCRVYGKSHVEIRLGYKQSLGIRFESNEEAQAYVDDLILGSDKEFHVIINK